MVPSFKFLYLITQFHCKIFPHYLNYYLHAHDFQRVNKNTTTHITRYKQHTQTIIMKPSALVLQVGCQTISVRIITTRVSGMLHYIEQVTLIYKILVPRCQWLNSSEMDRPMFMQFCTHIGQIWKSDKIYFSYPLILRGRGKWLKLNIRIHIDRRRMKFGG